MSEKTLVSKSRRLDNILDRKENQGMIQHIKSKLHSGVNIHTRHALEGEVYLRRLMKSLRGSKYVRLTSRWEEKLMKRRNKRNEDL
ncbi:hypothetical protein Bca4012_034059 [Brassica carinata]